MPLAEYNRRGKTVVGWLLMSEKTDLCFFLSNSPAFRGTRPDPHSYSGKVVYEEYLTLKDKYRYSWSISKKYHDFNATELREGNCRIIPEIYRFQ